ncbi:sensor histidine kinase [Carnimonas bestiolae]|uniref:sensor histidine kinase n=1 Tax=Carnimonas bestiolae TaxID=3402172 RepID=UPI003EDC9AB6
MSTPRYKKRLTRRIEWAVFAMCLMVATIFSCGTVYSILYIESETAQLNLGDTLDVLIKQQRRQIPIDADYASNFYTEAADGTGIPSWLRDTEDGFNRVSHAGSDWYALVRQQDDQRYILVQRSDALGWRQQHIYWALFICWAVCAGAGLLIGRWLVRIAIHPLIRLSNDVESLHSSTEHAPLATKYSNDEVGQLAASFDRATHEILTLLARERAFTGGVSHELRSPLMVIQGASELLLSAALPAEQRRVVKRIANASAQMEALVEAFLEMARGQQQPQRRLPQQPLETIVRDVIAQLERHSALPPGTLSLTTTAQTEKCYPPTFITIVLSNLLRNAIAYSNRATVEVSLDDEGIEVRDNAPLMGAEIFAHMLAPLTRGQTEQHRDGVGLGLAIVTRICDFMGWQLDYRVVDDHNCIRVQLEHHTASQRE